MSAATLNLGSSLEQEEASECIHCLAEVVSKFPVKPFAAATLCQVCLMNVQWQKRWSVSSKACRHKEQIQSQLQCLTSRFSAVRVLWCRVHPKNFCVGSAFALQFTRNTGSDMDQMNCARYALCTENLPVLPLVQVISSSWFSCSSIWLSKDPRLTSSWIALMVVICLKEYSQLLFGNSISNFLFFLFARPKSVGAMSLGQGPCNQLSFQKEIFLPLPMEICVHAWERQMSFSLQGLSIASQGLLWSCHLSHSHLSLRAEVNFSKSRIPLPPSSFGLHTMCQLTKLVPSLTFSGSSPFHWKALLILSILFRTHFGAGSAVRKWIGTEESTDLIKVSLPGAVQYFPFQPGIFEAILSIKGM